MAVGEYVSVSSQRDAEKINGLHHDDEEDYTNPWAAALASLIAFTLGGLVPFTAIIFATDNRIIITVIAVVIALTATGYFSAAVGGASKNRAITRIVIGGLIAMAITYFVGSIFGTIV